MSISKEPAASLAPAAAPANDPFDTALITRLANELFAENGPLGSTPASLPAPAAPRESGGNPTPAALPAIPSGATDDDSLAGGYPRASSPVHPVLTPAEPEATTSAPAKQPPSGAHDPAGGDAHAFGEPRCNGSVFGPSQVASPAKPTADPAPAFHRTRLRNPPCPRGRLNLRQSSTSCAPRTTRPDPRCLACSRTLARRSRASMLRPSAATSPHCTSV